MKNLIILILCAALTGCSAHRVVTDNSTPAPVTQQEQINVDNEQLSVHNNALAKAIVTTYQQGFMEKEYFDSLSREQINLTRLHKELTPLITDLATAKSNAVKIQKITDDISISVTKALTAVVGVKNSQSQQLIQSEIVAYKSAADSIFSILAAQGVVK